MPVDGYKQDTLFEAARRKLAELAPRISVLSPRERLAIPPQPMPERDPAERRRDMGISAIYPKPNTSKPGKGHKIYPYLLRDLSINYSNQVWAMDITYIPVQGGYLYLVAVIDIHSRYERV